MVREASLIINENPNHDVHALAKSICTLHGWQLRQLCFKAACAFPVSPVVPKPRGINAMRLAITIAAHSRQIGVHARPDRAARSRMAKHAERQLPGRRQPAAAHADCPRIEDGSRGARKSIVSEFAAIERVAMHPVRSGLA